MPEAKNVFIQTISAYYKTKRRIVERYGSQKRDNFQKSGTVCSEKTEIGTVLCAKVRHRKGGSFPGVQFFYSIVERRLH